LGHREELESGIAAVNPRVLSSVLLTAKGGAHHVKQITSLHHADNTDALAQGGCVLLKGRNKPRNVLRGYGFVGHSEEEVRQKAGSLKLDKH
jgi:hypothetical protein